MAKDIAEKRRIRAELKTQIEKETLYLTKIQTELDRVKEGLDLSLQQNQEPSKKPTKAISPSESTKEGFSLRFASDAALETLIGRRQVDFYAIAGKKAWQLKLVNGKPIYFTVNIPRAIYEMATHTVPQVYASEFHRQVAEFGRRTVTWGVTLPEKTISSINHLIKNRQQGNLVIMADAEVSIN
jgi:hypothetical protein